MIGQHNADYFSKYGATATAREISQQGQAWRKIDAMLARDAASIEEIAQSLSDAQATILFSGAGTSAYVGEIVAPIVTPILKARSQACASTDIVSNPAVCVPSHAHGLLFAFARSGNSPESVDSVVKIQSVAPNVKAVAVTCNPEGQLAHDERVLSLLMPPETHDESFVMTSSFSTMTLYTAALCRKAMGVTLPSYDDAATESERINAEGYDNAIFDIMAAAKRLIFLGSNTLYGAAREAALKVLEMTGGVMPTMSETALGFRHGPKSLVNDESVIVVFASNDSYTAQYDADIIRELTRDQQAKQIVVVASKEFLTQHNDIQPSELLSILSYSETLSHAPDDILAVLGVQYVQLLGLRLSIALGISPDNPCPSGEVNRVVKGVTLYPFPH